jgi:malate dehydrogenase (oxaloacetate-decarboxylating)(NADP+)
LFQEQAPWLEVDGEMHGDVALGRLTRAQPDAQQHACWAMPICWSCPTSMPPILPTTSLKTAAGGNIAIGPVLLGAAKPVHILTASTTVRRIVNMTALTVADANVKTG